MPSSISKLSYTTYFKFFAFLGFGATGVLLLGLHDVSNKDLVRTGIGFSLLSFALVYLWGKGSYQYKLLALLSILLVALNLSMSFNSHYYYDSKFGLITAHSILNTYQGEAVEFASLHSASFVFFAVLCSVALVLLSRITKTLETHHYRKYLWLFIIFNITMYGVGYFTTSANISGVLVHKKAINFARKTVLYNAAPLLKAWDEKNFMAEFSQNISYNYYPENYLPKKHDLTAIIVIGESARRDRLGLFGYQQPTTPYMSQRKEQLLTFSKANSSSTQTVLSVPASLTEVKVKQLSTDALRKNIVNLLNQSGYQTEWISMPGGGIAANDSYTSIIANFSDTLQTSAAKETGNATPVYDMQALAYTHPEANKVIFIHLNGSHPGFVHRYPSDFVSPLIKANAGEHKELYQYDMSIAYTDALLEQLIQKLSTKNAVLVYFSDHGLENRKGKLKHGSKSPSQESYEVPLFVWQSEKFKKHSTLSNQHTDKVFNTQDLFFTIADILGVTGYKGELQCRSIVQACYQETDNIVVDEMLTYHVFNSLKRENP